MLVRATLLSMDLDACSRLAVYPVNTKPWQGNKSFDIWQWFGTVFGNLTARFAHFFGLENGKREGL